MSIWSIIQTIVMLLIVIYLINVSLKYLAKHTTQSTKTMQIIQKIPVTKTSYLAIVKIIDQYYLMSLAEQQNQILRELTLEEQEKFQLEQQKNILNTDELTSQFKKVLSKKIGKGK